MHGLQWLTALVRAVMLALRPSTQCLINGVLVGRCIGRAMRVYTLIQAICLENDRGIVGWDGSHIAQGCQTPMRSLALRIILIVSRKVTTCTCAIIFPAFTALDILQACRCLKRCRLLLR